jgi:hypothetical protein
VPFIIDLRNQIYIIVHARKVKSVKFGLLLLLLLLSSSAAAASSPPPPSLLLLYSV